MSTLESIYAQLQTDLTAANGATGGDDTTVHDAIAALIDGYGASSGDFATGTVTLDRTVYNGNELTITHNLGKIPSFVFVAVVDGWAVTTEHTYTAVCGSTVNANGETVADMGVNSYYNMLRSAQDGTMGGEFRNYRRSCLCRRNH